MLRLILIKKDSEHKDRALTSGDAVMLILKEAIIKAMIRKIIRPWTNNTNHELIKFSRHIINKLEKALESRDEAITDIIKTVNILNQRSS